MKISNRTGVLTGLVFAVAISMAATHRPPDKYKNLKVLPKNISEQKMDSIMKSYNKALGIDCSFCHAPHATIKDSLDYASDAVHMKEEGRRMMRMTIDINMKEFNYKKVDHPVYLNAVTCYTCHRGEAIPE